MLQSPLSQGTTLIATAVAVWGLARGRWPERVAAGALAADWAGSILLQDHRWHHHLQGAIFVLDSAQASVLMLLVLSSRRTWVLWAAACALLLVLTHVAVLFDLRLGQWAYLTATYVWSLGLLAALALGMALEARKPVAPFRLRPLTAAPRSTPSATARSRN